MTTAPGPVQFFGLGLLARAFEPSLDAVEIDDIEGNVLYVNSAWCRLFQIDKQRAIGERWDILLFDVAEIAGLEQSWERCRAEGSSQASLLRRFDYREAVFVTYTRTLYRNADEVPVGIITIYRPQL